MGVFRRLASRLAQTDEERLADEVREWAESVSDTTRIGECEMRTPVRIAGVVRRMTIRPAEGAGSLEAVISDGTGEIVAAWTGRDQIPGLGLGTRLVLEGVCGRDRDGQVRKMVNPKFEFA
ncbi:MAG: DNA-binding protein [Actinomycetota bacterium]